MSALPPRKPTSRNAVAMRKLQTDFDLGIVG
jgi:hypothetical protein